MKSLRPQNRLLRPVLVGIFCLSSPLSLTAAPQTIQFMVRHFTVEGASPLPLKVQEDYFQALQQRQYTLKTLQEVGKGLELKIREQGYPFYRVILPPQTLDNGDVKLRIVSFVLGEVSVEGNHYFSKDNILASLPGLQSAGSPDTQDLAESIKVANKHPSKQLQLTFKQSEKADRVDAKINVAEQRPYQASLILNTVGTKSTGNFRMTGALQHSNLWGLDHIFNGSYTTSPDHADSVEQYGSSYSLPIYALKGWLSAYYAFSNVNNGTVASDFTVTGSGEMYGLHYQQFLPKWGRYEHWLDVGFDNRYFINDIQFQSNQIGKNVRSVPLSLLYKAEYPWRNSHFGYHVQWVGNTGVGDHNDQADYLAVQQNANQDWNLLRYGGNFSVNFQQWLIQTVFTAQYSQDALIAGEQIGVGGSYDVRGYQERETSADRGEIVKFEITTPTWQQFNLFAFYDYGHGRMENHAAGRFNDWSLSSTGVGASWQWQNYVQAKIAVANALDDAVTTRAGDSRIHASIVLRY
ncbi:MAG: ShlB/FhaC/HecB family hemolysin secretion/activation protein [Methylovulum sp.]|uniref:ShlB/FhaC/HecB family hemolysin secretion/activation protein n=1 Tax=Methylovulum sp. TaxID=1916980 RepID=UPI002623AB0F|nr:ShlB/FhaC/HecB family hemolysin secretion/activation protein [Methylovulum sp.]MDD2725048.1 ShlB/FhaC/HecB family hemolysin secretion/activation protein [Methylovulum sp.]